MEVYSNVATDGDSRIFGVDSMQQSSVQQYKTCSALTADNLKACAAVSPFVDFRCNANALMLSQSSTASSVTFDSSMRMDLESPRKNHQHRSGTIFDSVCFISDANNDNHSSVSMESPMRNCSMSLEPARKKARNEGAFGGLNATLTTGGMVVDPSNQVELKATKQCRCHVCGQEAKNYLVATPKSATAADSTSGLSNLLPVKPKAPKSQSLLNYFPKCKVSTKKPATFQHVEKLVFSPDENNPIKCHYCDKTTCSSCSRPCERCSRDFCTFCSKVDYRGVVEKVLCFECFNDENIERSYGSDVDMMDL
jgi:hypothetical protein